jgi:hypothetical protein
MASPAGIVAGKNIILSLNGVPIGCSTSAKISMDKALLEASCKESNGSREVTLGDFSWEMSTENIFKLGNAVTIFTLFNLLKGDTVFDVSWGTNLTGDQVFYGRAVCNHLEGDGPVSDNASFAATFTGTGDLILTTLASPY